MKSLKSQELHFMPPASLFQRIFRTGRCLENIWLTISFYGVETEARGGGGVVCLALVPLESLVLHVLIRKMQTHTAHFPGLKTDKLINTICYLLPAKLPREPSDDPASQQDKPLRTGPHHSCSGCAEAEMAQDHIQHQALPSSVFLTLLKVGEV